MDKKDEDNNSFEPVVKEDSLALDGSVLVEQIPVQLNGNVETDGTEDITVLVASEDLDNAVQEILEIQNENQVIVVENENGKTLEGAEILMTSQEIVADSILYVSGNKSDTDLPSHPESNVEENRPLCTGAEKQPVPLQENRNNASMTDLPSHTKCNVEENRKLCTAGEELPVPLQENRNSASMTGSDSVTSKDIQQESGSKKIESIPVDVASNAADSLKLTDNGDNDQGVNTDKVRKLTRVDDHMKEKAAKASKTRLSNSEDKDDENFELSVKFEDSPLCYGSPRKSRSYFNYFPDSSERKETDASSEEPCRSRYGRTRKPKRSEDFLSTDHRLSGIMRSVPGLGTPKSSPKKSNNLEQSNSSPKVEMETDKESDSNVSSGKVGNVINDSINDKENDWVVGDLAWGRLSGYPYWPCMISYDPGQGIFTKSISFKNTIRHSYHVQFYGDNAQHGWLSQNCLLKFTGLKDFEEYAHEKLSHLKKKDPKLSAQFCASKSLRGKWEIAVKDAEEAMPMTRYERIQYGANKFQEFSESDDATEEELFQHSPAGKKTPSPKQKQSVPSKSVQAEKVPADPYEFNMVKEDVASATKAKVASTTKFSGRFHVFCLKYSEQIHDEHPELSEEAVNIYLKKKWESMSEFQRSRFKTNFSINNRSDDVVASDDVASDDVVASDSKPRSSRRSTRKIRKKVLTSDEEDESEVPHEAAAISKDEKGSSSASVSQVSRKSTRNIRKKVSTSDEEDERKVPHDATAVTNSEDVPSASVSQSSRRSTRKIRKKVLTSDEEDSVAQVHNSSSSEILRKDQMMDEGEVQTPVQTPAQSSVESAPAKELQPSPSESIKSSPQAVSKQSSDEVKPARRVSHITYKHLSLPTPDMSLFEVFCLCHREQLKMENPSFAPKYIEMFLKQKWNNMDEIKRSQYHPAMTAQDMQNACEAIARVKRRGSTSYKQAESAEESEISHSPDGAKRIRRANKKYIEDITEVPAAEAINKSSHRESVKRKWSDSDSASDNIPPVGRKRARLSKKILMAENIDRDAYEDTSTPESGSLVGSDENRDRRGSSICLSLRQSSRSEKVCQLCEELGNIREDMVRCQGQCAASFHLSCLELDEQPESDFYCNDCKSNILRCFVCKDSTGDIRKCTVFSCRRSYHVACLNEWPQSVIMGRKIVCPLHVCHYCAADNPQNSNMIYQHRRLTRCIRCPTAYHSGNFCIAAGSVILSSTSVICPKHQETKKKGTNVINVSWCFICSKGGSLICCDKCPASFHVECLKIDSPEGGFVCEDCEIGKFVVAGDIVWVKIGAYRWWPAQVLSAEQIPDNIEVMAHNMGEFAVRFFGSHDYFWVPHGRAFLFEDGDKSHRIVSRSSIDSLFNKAIEEANEALKIIQDQRAIYKAATLGKFEVKIPPFVKLKTNRPFGGVRLNEVDPAELTPCDCDPNEKNPCGPESNCINRMLLVECHPSVCRAGEKCCNQRFQKREYPALATVKTHERGFGLKVQVDVKQGDFMIEYVGEIIDEDEYKRRIEKKHKNNDENFYFLGLDNNRILDAGPKGNLARFMNHSCQPNCETQKWTVNGETRVGLFALCDIPADTEINFNYNLVSVGTGKKPCLCGAPNCSGFIGVKAKAQMVTDSDKKGRKKKKRKIRKPNQPKPASNTCFRCGTGGQLITCDRKRCPKAYHLQCLHLRREPPGKWVCPWHHCNVCAAPANRLCLYCTTSFCQQHSEGNIKVDKILGMICHEHNKKERIRLALCLKENVTCDQSKSSSGSDDNSSSDSVEESNTIDMQKKHGKPRKSEDAAETSVGRPKVKTPLSKRASKIGTNSTPNNKKKGITKRIHKHSVQNNGTDSSDVCVDRDGQSTACDTNVDAVDGEYSANSDGTLTSNVEENFTEQSTSGSEYPNSCNADGIQQEQPASSSDQGNQLEKQEGSSGNSSSTSRRGLRLGLSRKFQTNVKTVSGSRNSTPVLNGTVLPAKRPNDDELASPVPAKRPRGRPKKQLLS